VIRKLLIALLLLGALLLIAFAACEHLVQAAGKGKVFDRVDAIPARQYGLLLGTSAHRRDGGENPYFKYRIEAGARLYRTGKVKVILVSGDNRTKDYDEPDDMKQALIAHGVPASAIRTDYAGVRTLDSVVRAKRVFWINHFTIISQRDHDERALLIAQHNGIDAIAYAADDVDFHYAVRAHIHEWLAEIWVVLDLWVFHTQPRRLGPHVRIS
jgi:SanA protein